MKQMIAKYVEVYHNAHGTSTEKVKKILMHHSHTWEWMADSIISDLIDDTTLQAEDIVDFLADSYRIEGGSEEFHYAICALQICLRKGELERLSLQKTNLEETFMLEEDDVYDSDVMYADANCYLLNTMRY